MECATVNAVTIGIRARKRRKGITRQNRKQQVIGSIQNVHEPQLYEAPRGLMPARIELNYAGVAGKFESPYRAARRQKSQYRNGSHPQASQSGVDRKAGSIVLDRVFQQSVE